MKRERLRKMPTRLFAEDNPHGRPKNYRALKEVCRAHTLEAIQTLVYLMRNVDKDAALAIRASEALLDRGWGKPENRNRFGIGGEDNDTAIPAVLLTNGMMSPEQWLKKYGKPKPIHEKELRGSQISPLRKIRK